MNKCNEAIKLYYNQISSYSGESCNNKKADKHMDGFTDFLIEAVPPELTIQQKHKAAIKGAILKKRWDIACSDDHGWTSALELKSIVYSKMGKCFSNRIEEAIGVATDLRHVNKAIKLNYFLVIELDQQKSEAKINKIKDFCNFIEKKTKLYNNVCAILITEDGSYEEVYSTVDSFTQKWSGGQNV